MKGYTRRIVDDEVDALLTGVAALALQGPRAVGKTATAARRAATVHRLDQDNERQVIEASPKRAVTGEPPVLLDEWQRFPQSWDLVRRAVDEDRTPGRFLLTGSVSPIEHPTHSGAGRIVTVRMRPLSIAERGLSMPSVSLAALLARGGTEIEGRTEATLDDYTTEILASGFPGIRGLPGRVLRAELDGYLDRALDRDVGERGVGSRAPDVLRRWLASYAAATATTTTYERIREAATISDGTTPARSTAIAYRDALAATWLLDPVPGWVPTRNRLKRLSAPPKHHLADPALAARLLRVDAPTLLAGRGSEGTTPRDGSLLGGLFESLVTQSVRVYAQDAEAATYHLRTKGGEHEVDLVIVGEGGAVVGIEVKLAASVSVSDGRHLRWLREQLGPEVRDLLIITTGSEAYRRPDGIAVIPLALLGP